MKAFELIEKTREYLDYLEEHITFIALAHTRVSNACSKMDIFKDPGKMKLLKDSVDRHDLSKFSKEEFVQYRQKFFACKTELVVSSDFDNAWENHKVENHHHWETIEDELDVIHMIIDHTAMGYKFGDTAKAYYESNKEKINIDSKWIPLMYEMYICIEESLK